MSLNETAEKVKEVKKVFQRGSKDNGVEFENLVKLIAQQIMRTGVLYFVALCTRKAESLSYFKYNWK
jgi:hypothetical protein